jgi:hypothetical protein
VPQLILHAYDTNDVCKNSQTLLEALADVMDTPIDWFTIEVMSSQFVFGNQVIKGAPKIEVLWFERGQEVQDKAAKLIDDWSKALGYADLEMWFTPLDKSRYYENGEHY